MSYGQPQYPQYPPAYPAQYPGYPPGPTAPPPSGGPSCGTIALVLIIFCLLVCCGGGIGLYFLGTNVIEEQVREELSKEPAVQQHVGRIYRLKWVSTKVVDPDVTHYVFEVYGEKGVAKASIDLERGEGIVEGELELPDGTRVPLAE